jgi:tetratricopeptide (TPR) repeat protein
MLVHRRTVILLTVRNNVPAIGADFPMFAREGGLLSYGANFADIFRRAAPYVDRILRGANPRREQIELQVALITPLEYVKGYAAPETKAAIERARLLIEQAERLGEPPDDPLLLFSVLYGSWVANNVAFNGDIVRELSTQILALAQKQGATVPLMIGHRIVGTSLLFIGEIAEGRGHLDQAIGLYEPAAHRALATRFGQDIKVATLFWRSWVLWMLGYPASALADAEQAVKEAREIGQVGTLAFALQATSYAQFLCGKYSTAMMQSEEGIVLANEKGSLPWKGWGMMNQGCVFAFTGKETEAVHAISSGIEAWRRTGGTLLLPGYLPNLAVAHAKLRRFDDARQRIAEAMTAVIVLDSLSESQETQGFDG